MASPVPYDPTPQVAASGQGISPISGDAPASAFGSGVADAVTHLGAVEQAAGSELYDRALAMQTLDEQAKATKAAADASTAIGIRREEFNSTEGQNTVDGFQPFIGDVNKLREQYGEGLSPAARKAYDSDTRRTQSATIISASGYAATQHKKVIIGASDARIDAANNEALLSGGDINAFNNSLAVVKKEAAFKAAAAGQSPEAAARTIYEAESKTRVSYLEGLADQDPFAAGQLLNEWTSAKPKGAGTEGGFVGAETKYVPDDHHKRAGKELYFLEKLYAEDPGSKPTAAEKAEIDAWHDWQKEHNEVAPKDGEDKGLDSNRGDGDQPSGIEGQSLALITDYIKQKQYTRGSRTIASGIMDGKTYALGERTNNTVDNIAEAVAGIESSNKWIGRHPMAPNGDFAVGRYGIMSRNLPSWLKISGLDPTMSVDEFIADHDAQRKVATTMMGQMLKKYNGNANLVAVEWFSGARGVQKYLAGRGGGLNDGNTSLPGYLKQFNANLAGGATGADLSSLAADEGNRILPGDSQFTDILDQHIQTLHNRQESMQRELEQTAKQKINELLNSGMPDGSKVTTVADLVATPEGSDAWDAMKETDKRIIMESMTRTARGEFNFTPETQKQYMDLVGRATSEDRTPKETDDFLNINAAALKMPLYARLKIQDLQQKLLKGDNTQAQTLTQAMSVLNATMPGAIPAKADDPELYHQFRGSLFQVIQDFQDENKRRPTTKEVQEMGTLLTQQVLAEKHGVFWDSTTNMPLYQVPVPDDASAAITADYQSVHNGAVPSADEIHSIYVEKRYQELVNKKSAQEGSTPPAPSPTGPAVPGPTGLPLTPPASSVVTPPSAPRRKPMSVSPLKPGQALQP